MPPTGWAEAQLRLEDDLEPPIKGWFNPKEYTISRANDWKVEKVVGQDLPVAQFGGGEPRTITLALVVDASDERAGDVQGVIDRLFKMMDIVPKLGSGEKNSGRPPMVTFAWGQAKLFQAVVKRVGIQHLLFHPDGRPIRAQVTLELTQAARAEDKSQRPDPKKPNPTTRGDVRAVHVVRDGDSLQSIAYGAFGDATRWRAIAEANGVDDPLHIPRGTELAIPRSPL
jgi:hypothetical protein